MISGCVSSPGPSEPHELTQKKVLGQHSPFSSSVGLTCIWGLERGHRGWWGCSEREVNRGAAHDRARL